MPSITERVVRALSPGQKVMCTRTPCFGVRKTVKRKDVVFFIRKRTGGREYKCVLGKWPAISVRQARQLALRRLVEIQRVATDTAEQPTPLLPRSNQDQRIDALMRHFGLDGETQAMTFRQLWETLQEPFLEPLGESTKKTYLNYLQSVLLPQWGDKALVDITTHTVAAWALNYKGAAGGKPAQPLKILRGLMKMGKTLGHVRHELKIPGAYKSKRGEEIAPDDFKRLREHLRSVIASGDSDIRYKMLAICVYTGERNKALCSLRADEVDARSGLVTKERKGGKVEPIPYPKEALDIIATITPVRGWLFPHPDPNREHVTPQNLRRFFQTLCKKLDIWLPSGDVPKIHSIRHATLTYYANRANLQVAQTIAGHASRKTTERYTHKDRQLAKEEADKVW